MGAPGALADRHRRGRTTGATEFKSLYRGRRDSGEQLGPLFSDQAPERVALCLVSFIREYFAKPLDVETRNNHVKCNSAIRDCAIGDHFPPTPFL